MFWRADLCLKYLYISDVFFLPRQKSHCIESPKSNVRGAQTLAETADPLPENQEHWDGD